MRHKHLKRLFVRIGLSMKLRHIQNVALPRAVVALLVVVGVFHLVTYMSKFEIKLIERQADDDGIIVEYEYVEENYEADAKPKPKPDNLEYDGLGNMDLEQAQYNYRYRYNQGNKGNLPVNLLAKFKPHKYHNVTRVCSMRERLDHLHKYCDRDKTVDDTFQHKDLLVDEKHRVLYCSIPRAASTSWRTVFAKTTGKVPKNITWPPVHSKTFINSLGLKFLGDFDKPEADRIAREFYKVIVVRHPFDRLISAWRDRLVVRNSPSRWSLGMAILAEYRDESHYELSREWNDTARFFEFAEYIADKSPDDSEWDTFTDVCDVCMYKWNAILRVETSYNDSYHILKRFPNFDGELPFLHSHVGDIKEILHIQKILTEMSLLSPKALENLKNKYEADFEIFGYEWNPEQNMTRCAIPTPRGDCC